MYKDLAGKVALITGAGKRSGIGYAIARKLAESGTNIIITDIGGPSRDSAGTKLGTLEEMEAVTADLRSAFGVESLAIPMDVTQNESIDAARQNVEEHFGGLDILVNNAGVALGVPSTVHNYNETAWLRTFDVNVHGVYRVSREFFPFLSQRKGRIIHIASRAGKTPAFLNGAYSATKAAVIMMTKVMAKEMAGAGVRVNALCPGIIMTDLQVMRFELEAKVFGSTFQERQSEHAKSIPLGWVGDPREVAAMTAFLASDESSYITGQAINVCGGLTMEL
jgi:NAD(P)-dependent dehydrogenase (short-subunit alcohol dehydrogenase family)